MKIWAHNVEAFIAALDIKTANEDTMGLLGIVIPPHVSVTESSDLWAGCYMVEDSLGEYEVGALERAGINRPTEDA